MQVELITKQDLNGVESRLDQLINSLHANVVQSNGIYTTAELARKLRVSTRTIQMWRSRRLIEYHKINRKVYYTENAVIAFLEAYTIKRVKF